MWETENLLPLKLLHEFIGFALAIIPTVFFCSQWVFTIDELLPRIIPLFIKILT